MKLTPFRPLRIISHRSLVGDMMRSGRGGLISFYV